MTDSSKMNVKRFVRKVINKKDVDILPKVFEGTAHKGVLQTVVKCLMAADIRLQKTLTINKPTRRRGPIKRLTCQLSYKQ